MTNRWIGWLLVCLSLAACQAVAAPATPPLVVGVADDEALGPFQSWANVHDYGAVGDGRTDDTRALQRALDDLGEKGRAAVLYLPAGRYRISKTLNLFAKRAINIVGEDPASTTVWWGGDPGGVMLLVNGVAFAQFSRLTWDGNKQAAVGVAQWWDHTQTKQWTNGIRHVDEVFVDVGTGIAGGRQDPAHAQMDSEVAIVRSRFIRNTLAGVAVGSFNALDWWVWDSEFIDCARGVSNDAYPGQKEGAGNFMVYRSVFKGSKVADVSLFHRGWFALHHNVSVGSRRFVEARDVGRNDSELILQGNRVLDTLEPEAVRVDNMGPLILIDNQIRSRTGAAGPVVRMNGWATGRDVVSVGNRYTVPGAIQTREAKADRVLSLEDRVVPAASISSEVPASPKPARNHARHVFEVPPGAKASMIQAVINLAAKSEFDNPVVHLPAGVYSLDQSLVLPARRRLQLVGDGERSLFTWAGPGSGTMLRLAGPSYATVKDFGFHPGSSKAAVAVGLDAADQPGGLIRVDGGHAAAIELSDLAQSRVEIQSLIGGDTLLADACNSVTLVGSGVVAPFKISRGSNLLVYDTWYEGQRADLVRGDSGNFTLMGGHFAPSDPVHGGGAPDPAIHLNGFKGQVSVVGLSLWMPVATNGIRVENETAQTHALFLGLMGNQERYFDRRSKGGRVAWVAPRKFESSKGATVLPEAPDQRSDQVLQGLAQTRSVVWDAEPRASTPGATDVRLLGLVTVDSKAVGLRVVGK